MAGRRSHPRFRLRGPWEGALKVLRDVVIDSQKDGELLAVSHVPGVTGELMSLNLLGNGSTVELTVKVLESRPVIVTGAVRHRLRLAVLQATGGLAEADNGPGGNADGTAEAR